jgi:hypothetical protein
LLSNHRSALRVFASAPPHSLTPCEGQIGAHSKSLATVREGVGKCSKRKGRGTCARLRFCLHINFCGTRLYYPRAGGLISASTDSVFCVPTTLGCARLRWIGWCRTTMTRLFARNSCGRRRADEVVDRLSVASLRRAPERVIRLEGRSIQQAHIHAPSSIAATWRQG